MTAWSTGVLGVAGADTWGGDAPYPGVARAASGANAQRGPFDSSLSTLPTQSICGLGLGEGNIKALRALAPLPRAPFPGHHAPSPAPRSPAGAAGTERRQHQRPPRPRAPSPRPVPQAITPPAPHPAAPLEPQAQSEGNINALRALAPLPRAPVPRPSRPAPTRTPLEPAGTAPGAAPAGRALDHDRAAARMAADPRAIALVTLAFALREGRRTECQAELGRVHSLATPVARPKRLFEFPMRTLCHVDGSHERGGCRRRVLKLPTLSRGMRESIGSGVSVLRALRTSACARRSIRRR